MACATHKQRHPINHVNADEYDINKIFYRFTARFRRDSRRPNAQNGVKMHRNGAKITS